MRDFRAYAAARLRLDALDPARAVEVVDEVARQLEDAYAEALAGGASAEAAFAAAEAHVPDWDGFSRELLRGERRSTEARLEAPGPALPRFAGDLATDLVHGARVLRKNRIFSAVAILTLALGIGANAALFSLADAVLFRMLPVREPEQLRLLEWTARRAGFHRSYSGSNWTNAAGERVARSISYPAYLHLRDHGTSFAALSAFGDLRRVNLGLHGGPELALSLVVSADFFETLGTPAVLGRTFTREDDREGSLTAVLSHGCWTRLFGGDPAVVGQPITVNGAPTLVIGVLPRGVCGVTPWACPDVFLPMPMQSIAYVSPDVRGQADRWGFRVVARLKAGVSEEQARAGTELLLRQAVLAIPPQREYDLPRVALLPGGQGQDELRSELRPTLRLLGGSVALVLLTACANIAGLMLVRATARRREIATRLALGASRGRLVRQLLAESLLLSALGGMLGVALAWGGGARLAWALIDSVGAPGVAPALDLRVLAFLVVLCAGTGLLFGLAPALRATAIDSAAALTASRATARGASFRAGKALITLQVALSLVLVVGSALFVRSLLKLRSESLGFRPEGLLVFQLNPALSGYKEQRLLDFHQAVVERLLELPEVRSASMSKTGILSGGRTADGMSAPGRPGIGVNVHYVAPRFFETLGFPIRAGRDFAATDREGAPRVVVINEALARQLPPGQPPVGRELRFRDAPVEVVGLVADTKYESLRRAAPATVYVPFRQSPQSSMTYVVRSEVDPKRLAAAVRRAVSSVDPGIPLYELKTQTEQIERALRRERLFASALSGFALLTLALAAMGVYATLAYLVARRTPEIGVRMALGATRADIVRLVLAESSAPVLLGIALGLWGSLAAGRLVQGLLFGLAPQDTAALLTAAAVLIASALIAAWLPARRAARIAPVEALRCD